LILVTFLAIDYAADKILATFFGLHPLSYKPGRIVPHMVPVPAAQIRHPVTLLILVKANNRLFHKFALNEEPIARRGSAT
jgi:hypothetical protein